MDFTSGSPGQHASFALADTEHGRLFLCSGSQRRTQHIDEQDVIENTLPEQQHARPAEPPCER